MDITVTGTIKKKGFGFGVWALVTPEGTTYELKDPTEKFRREISQVTIKGKIRKDIMTIAMIGSVLEVESFAIISL